MKIHALEGGEGPSAAYPLSQSRSSQWRGKRERRREKEKEINPSFSLPEEKLT